MIEPKYGRLLDDFNIGEVYHHPWEVTIDDGLIAVFAASFLDPNPLYSSRRYATGLGFRDRVVPPLVLLNLALSFSVHDVSEQTLAHLAYIDLRFPSAAYSGDTIRAFSEVVGTRRSSSKPDLGIAHVRTVAVNQENDPVITFERKALIPVGRLKNRAHPDRRPSEQPGSERPGSKQPGADGSIPGGLYKKIALPFRQGRLKGMYEDFEPGDVILHDAGRTVGESEHMQLTVLSRNTHPLHTDEVYSRSHSIAGTRLVCGGLVFAWVASLASRDTSANALWEAGFDRGSHPNTVVAGDTLYAASRVIEKRDLNRDAGLVRFQLVGLKNLPPARLVEQRADLFGARVEQKVFDIERTLLLPKTTGQ